LPDTRIILIRHGETAWNAERRIQGRLDVPLSSTGIRQAARLADRLADESIDAVISSDLARAWLTAQPLAQRLGLEPREDTRIRERDFGSFQGFTLDEVARNSPEHFRAWRDRDPAWAMPGGESGAQFIARVIAAVEDIVCSHPDRTVALVTHGGVLDVIYRHARQLAWDAPRAHQMLNAAINELGASAPPLRLILRGWGDVAHLASARDEAA
jgi:2,3-bisphosphoglycerate-dependent phosphoglycerate mutase